ncbi:MAG: STAS-like domain-containing protein [Bdellovibrionales bacterium]
MKINIAKDFSPFPAGRYTNEGPRSGQAFRTEMLLPAIQKGSSVEIELDGTEGYGSSFLEEAFGGLIRVEGLSAEDLLSKIVLVSDDEELKKEILEYIHQANPE